MLEFLESVSDQDGFIQPNLVARYFDKTVAEILDMSDIPSSAAEDPVIQRSNTNQQRLHTAIAIINQVRPWTKDQFEAYAWYRSEPIPAFGNQTAEAVVKSGKIQALKLYLATISLGGFA
ncbi:hypothetical protein [Reinekea sp. G2M2-21]|uniref:hypothetical protein n=1 Tax=Reinekea sp. G2M2-21 TaxID=2788942 RepID=UPI0018A977B7|nr:hypothetical protein [Reinekea sp. G2M2-21]